MAVAIGVNEALIMAAAAAPPYGTDEYYLAGGLSQESVILTKCQTVDLEVPASSEIVLEGKILPTLKIPEGPFLDYSGDSRVDSSGRVFEVSCLMHRDNPIFRGSAIGISGGEDHILFSLLSRSNCLDLHGSIVKQKIQNLFLKRGWLRAFQTAGKWKQFMDRF
jgi:UbiD family decarboxylase